MCLIAVMRGGETTDRLIPAPEKPSKHKVVTKLALCDQLSSPRILLNCEQTTLRDS
jgi:hypothetical protein